MLELVLQTEARSWQTVAGWSISRLQNLGCAECTHKTVHLVLAVLMLASSELDR